MRPRQLSPFVVLILAVLESRSQAQDQPPARNPEAGLAAEVDALFAAWDRPESPGCAVAVVRGGEILLARGYGSANLEYDVPITPATIFHVASVSKQFTAFGIAMLAEQGKLSLNDDIRQYLPEVPDFGPTITIEQLIHHTSGLRDQWDLLMLAGWRMDDVITKQQILKMVERQRELNFPPGTRHLYCNTGYTLLAVIIERVGKKPFPEWMKEHVFEPLGMASTFFYDDHERVVKGRAYSYKLVAGMDYKKAVLNYANAGATSLFTTVLDLTRWMSHLTKPRIGGASVRDQMLECGVLKDGQTLDYAFGLQVDSHRGLRRIGHSGGDAGYRSYLGVFPDQDLGVVVLSNLASFDPYGKAMQVAELFLADDLEEAERERRAPAPNRPAPFHLDPGLLDGYAGRYHSPELETDYVVVITTGELVMTHQRHDDVALRPIEKDRFIRPGRPSVALDFDRDEAGRVNGLRISTARVKNLRFQKAP